MHDPKLVDELIEKARKFVGEMDYYYDFRDVAPGPHAEQHEQAREDVRKVIAALGVKV